MKETLLNNIKANATYLGKSEMTSGNESRITMTYKGNKISFNYHDNHFNESDKEHWLYALMLDSQSYEDSYDVEDFARNFGYDLFTNQDLRKVTSIYNACKKQHERFMKLFNVEEQTEIKRIFENY